MHGTHKDEGKGEGQRGVGRVNMRGSLAAGKTWGEIKQLSKNRVTWRHFVNALCSSGS
jgi:hypothetical protein